PSPLIAAIGSMRSPTLLVCGFRPPHFPRKSTAFGSTMLSKSITVPALGLPMPKLIILISPWVADCIARPIPRISQPNLSENNSTYLVKLVSKIYFPYSSGIVPVYLGNQSVTISFLVFISKYYLDQCNQKFVILRYLFG